MTLSRAIGSKLGLSSEERQRIEEIRGLLRVHNLIPALKTRNMGINAVQKERDGGDQCYLGTLKELTAMSNEELRERIAAKLTKKGWLSKELSAANNESL